MTDNETIVAETIADLRTQVADLYEVVSALGLLVRDLYADMGIETVTAIRDEWAEIETTADDQACQENIAHILAGAVAEAEDRAAETAAFRSLSADDLDTDSSDGC